MQNNKGKSALSLAVTILILVGALGYAFSIMTSDMGLTISLTEIGLSITHKGSFPLMSAESFEVPYEEIEGWEILSQFPTMNRDWGLGNSKARVGDFSNEELGEVKVYVANVNQPLVLLRTASHLYIVSPTDIDAFVTRLTEAIGR